MSEALLAAVEAAARTPGPAVPRLCAVCAAWLADPRGPPGGPEDGPDPRARALEVVDWCIDAVALERGLPTDAGASARAVLRATLVGAEALRPPPAAEAVCAAAVSLLGAAQHPAGALPAEAPGDAADLSSPPPPEDEPPSDGSPDLFEFTSYRDFLTAWLLHRAGRPSARGLALRVGISPALLSAVRSGQRDLNPWDAERLAEAMHLEGRARGYFLDLVEYNQAGPASRRAAALDRVMLARSYRSARRLVDHAWAVFRRWYVPAVAELTRCEGFREDPAWIAQTVVPAITVGEAAAALEALEGVGVLERDDAGRLRPSSSIFVTDHEVRRAQGVAVGAWHLALLERAAAALDTVPPPERHFGAAALPVSEAGLAALKEQVLRFMETVVAAAGAEAGPRDRVVQLSLQLFPLSRQTTGPTG